VIDYLLHFTWLFPGNISIEFCRDICVLPGVKLGCKYNFICFLFFYCLLEKRIYNLKILQILENFNWHS